MAVLTAFAAVDMTDWNFDNIASGTITTFSSLKYKITGGDGTLYEFTGFGLTYNGAHELTGGTVTGYSVRDAGGDLLLSVSGINLGGAAVQSAIDTNDAGGAFEEAAFAHGNTITGSDFDDVLQAFSSATEDIYGGDGNDIIIADTVSLSTTDNVFGGAGDDTVYVGDHWTLTPVDGGIGYDTVVFDGNYPLGINLTGSFVGIEQILFLGGPEYHLVAGGNGLIETGATLRIDGSSIAGAGARMDFDGKGEIDGHYEFVASTGNDNLRGGDQSDAFFLDRGGRDRAVGGLGDDAFFLGNKLGANDRIHGGGGTNDTIVLEGDYSAGVTFGAHTARSVEIFELVGGHSYSLTLADSVGGPGASLGIVGISLGTSDTMFVDASAETDASITIIDGQGDDTIVTGLKGDTIFISAGVNVIDAGGGDDGISYISNNFSAAEQIDGGDGHDALGLTGDYSSGVVLSASTLTSIEELTVGDGFSYDITFDDANVAADETFTVTSSLTEPYSFDFDGSAELDAKFVFVGAESSDTFIGGARADTFNGGAGVDHLAGGAGNDTFIYLSADDSTGRFFDTIDGLDGNGDKLSVPVTVAARDADITGGSLNNADFDAKLTSKVDAAHLAAGNFVIYKPGTGDFGGATFLVVDQNGVAGYQSGSDLVILLTNATHLGGLDAADFV